MTPCKPVCDTRGDFLSTATFQPHGLVGVCPCGCGRKATKPRVNGQTFGEWLAARGQDINES